MFTRARQIAAYNWPLYLAAAIGAAIGGSVAAGTGAPPALRVAGLAGALAAGWLTCSSFLAFWWMFDLSELSRGRWLSKLLPGPPARWVEISAGLEETTLPLEQAFPGTPGQKLDIFDPVCMTAPALNRARQQQVDAKPASEVVVAHPSALPVADGWADVVCVTLAAHEIRSASGREQFYRELARIVAVDGRVVVVEHLRDLLAALAFGPGLFHFYPRREWLRLGSLAGLELEREHHITPWVRVFIFEAQPGKTMHGARV